MRIRYEDGTPPDTAICRCATAYRKAYQASPSWLAAKLGLDVAHLWLIEEIAEPGDFARWGLQPPGDFTQATQAKAKR